jgi:hypothetical protein
MNVASMTLPRRIRAIVVGVSLGACAAPLAAQRVQYNLFTDPSNRYSVEFPKDWKWTVVAGAGEALATFVHPRAEAAIVVERFRMKMKLDQDEITDVFSTIEVDWLKENQPRVMDVNARIATQGKRKVVQIDYRRPGIGEPGKAEDERVRQFSFPVGGSVYRITCATLASRFNNYEAIFQWVAESLKSAEELSNK